MKTKNLFAVAATLTTLALGAGCGLQSSDGGGNPPPSCGSDCTPPASDGGTGTTPAPDAGTSTTTDGGTPTVMPAPVVSPAACRMEFANAYISGSPCGDVLGDLPGMTWTSGQYIRDTDGDGRLELQYTAIPAGDYALSYRDRECPGETPQAIWANYGAPEFLSKMTADARQFIYCNWWDATNKRVVQAPDTNGDGLPDPSCEIHVSVDASCGITGNGNMRDYQ